MSDMVKNSPIKALVDKRDAERKASLERADMEREAQAKKKKVQVPMDPDVEQGLMSLRRKMQGADPELVKAMVKAEVYLRTQGEQMIKLQELKLIAIENEDYVTAKDIKMRFEQLKQQALAVALNPSAFTKEDDRIATRG